jgi:hypothetical protein
MVQVIQRPDKFQGLAAALQGIIQGQAARHQKQQQANQIASVNQFFQAGGTGPAPQVDNPAAQQLLTQGLGQQRQFSQQREQAIAIQNLKNKAAAGKTSLRVVEDPETGEFIQQLQDEQGNVIRELGPATPTQIKQGVTPETVAKPTIAKIEKDLIDLQSTVGELDVIKDDFDPNFFLTFDPKNPLGDSKFSAFITERARKFGVTPSAARQDFLDRKTKFFADSKRVFLKFRKFITGVAGGMQEFKEIAKSTIDPEKDSDISFMAKMRSMRENAMRLDKIMRTIRDKGFEPTKDNIKAELNNAGGLDNIEIGEGVQQEQVQQAEPISPAIQQQTGIPSLQELRNMSTPPESVDRNSIVEQDLDNLTLEQLQNL